MKQIILRNLKLIDGTGKEPISDGVVVINGNKIEQIGSKKKIKIPEDAEVLDVGEGTILPGLIDAHMHFMGVSSLNNLMFPIEPEPLKTVRAAASCAKLINAGFTSVRDMGGIIGVYLKRAIAEGVIQGPRISSALRILSQTGGHGDIHMLPIDFVKSRGFGRICDGADECRKAAREQFREGADFIKICSTGGAMSEKGAPGFPQFTIDEISAIVEEARRVKSYVASHAQGAEGINNALKAGVKTIEHGYYLDNEGMELMLKNDAILVPTLVVGDRICTKGDEHGVPEYALRKARESREVQIETIQRARKAGIKIALGTDFNNVPLLPFGENALELELFVKLVGFSAMEAIVAGTKISAEALQMGDKIGTLEKGKFADLIVVNGDPIVDISCLRNPDNITLVIKDGIIEKNIS